MVVGMGHVGIPVALSFAKAGLEVVGIDVDADRVDALSRGTYPLRSREPGIRDLLEEVAGDTFTASTDFTEVADADHVLVAVPTPFDTDEGLPRYDALRDAVRSIGDHLRPGTLVVVESTISPTTMDSVVKPLLEETSGLVAGEEFMLGHAPERVMPGRLLSNLRSYDRVLGGIDEATREAMRDLYSRVVKGRLDAADMLTAEVVKTFENTYRDVEIALANEFARYCDAVGVDFHVVREMVNRVEDRNLHLPGGGVGGHCIPKDPYLLAHGSRDRFTPELVLLARAVNDAMPGYVADLVLEALQEADVEPSGARAAVLGAAYRPDTEDARNTPTVPLVQRLEADGMEVTVHDPYVRDVDVEVTDDLDAAVDGADVLVVMTAHSDYDDLDLGDLGDRMGHRVLVDGRDLFSPQTARDAGFVFRGIGRR